MFDFDPISEYAVVPTKSLVVLGTVLAVLVQKNGGAIVITPQEFSDATRVAVTLDMEYKEGIRLVTEPMSNVKEEANA